MKSSKAPAMVVTPRVVDTINSLPDSERGVITSALAQQFILGRDPADTLTPTQAMIYAVISSYVIRDTCRMAF